MLPEDQRLLLGFQHKLLLLLLELLLPKPMQELVRLGHDLRDQGIVVEVLDVHYLSIHFEVFVCCLVNVCYQILIL